MIVEFETRPGYDGWGDLTVDGREDGWAHIDEAREVAALNGVDLTVVTVADYVAPNPRREEATA